MRQPSIFPLRIFYCTQIACSHTLAFGEGVCDLKGPSPHHGIVTLYQITRGVKGATNSIEMKDILLDFEKNKRKNLNKNLSKNNYYIGIRKNE